MNQRKNQHVVRTTLVGAAIAGLLSLTACAGMSQRGQNTAVGAAVGGVAGSVLTGGSTAGAVGGAVIGGVVGSEGTRKDR